MALLLILAGVAALAAFWVFFSWHFNYWKERGVVSCNPYLLTGDRGGGLPVGGPFYEMLTPIYRKYKGKEKAVGFFQSRRPILVPLDPEIIKDILTKNFASFHSRGQPRDESDPFSQNLVFLEGAQWKNLRTRLSPTFTSGKLRGMLPLMAGVQDQLSDALRQKAEASPKQQVEMKDLLVRYSTDIIGTVAFGIDCNTLQGKSEDFLEMSRDVFTGRNWLFVLRFLLISMHPIFGKILPFKWIFAKATVFFQDLMSSTVTYRKENNVQRNDFVQTLIQLQDEDKRRDFLERANHVELTNDVMAAQAFVFFIAGLDNVANTVGFALHEMALNPDLQQRAVEEVRAKKASNGGEITYEALRQMDLVERIVREALRKYTPAGLLTRQSNGPVKISGLNAEIDSTVMIMIPVYQAMHDPTIFPEPAKFDPDRFTEEAKQGRHQYDYLPFGEGPRFCIAERFVIFEMKLCLAGLLDKHHFSVGPKTAVALEMDPKAGAPTPKHGFWLRVEDRL